MIEWVEELRARLNEEFKSGPHVMTLATVDADHRPRVRTVVCRRVVDETVRPHLLVTSDARSRKNGHVAQQPWVEACFWLSLARRQFRLFGTARLLTGWWPVPADEQIDWSDARRWRESVWGELSEATRATFYWPQPGSPRVYDPSHFPRTTDESAPPENFELIALTPVEVELLDLREHPHRRVRWHVTEEGRWDASEVNP